MYNDSTLLKELVTSSNVFDPIKVEIFANGSREMIEPQY